MNAVKTDSIKSSARTSVLSDDIYGKIKAMVVTYEISPGSRINIDALSLQLKTSQTPIREALARLESDGLIKKEPLKGYSATNLLTLDEFHDLFQFRLLIEPWAAEQAAKRITFEGKRILNSEMKSTLRTLKQKNVDEFKSLTEHDARFHKLVAQLSGSKSVESAFERTHCHLHLFRLFMAHRLHLIKNSSGANFVEKLFEHYYQNGSGQLAIIEHNTISNAIIDGDSKTARASMHSHIQSSLKRFSSSVQ
ncbi:MAG: GntR family transcriptional regulator [Candidatus Planktophila sp.]|nr:GntR family transcriptional regulator [Candidatus Planktophila sp.]